MVRACAPFSLPGRSSPEVISPFLEGDVLLDLVRFLKFEGGTAIVGWLGMEMAAALEERPLKRCDAVIVPVPLHWTRLARRGYDQAGLLAAEVSRLTGIPLRRRVLGRRRRTMAQSSLERGNKKKNVDGAFRLRSPRRIRGRDVVLVDDLVTTGETVLDCCRALYAAAPASVTVLCAGRARPGKNKVECPDCPMFE
jgi:ComF family protein